MRRRVVSNRAKTDLVRCCGNFEAEFISRLSPSLFRKKHEHEHEHKHALASSSSSSSSSFDGLSSLTKLLLLLLWI
jgi:hypothetical protein